MNSPTLDTPPASPQQNDRPKFLVAVKLTVPVPIPGFLPKDNLAGTVVLARLFLRELAALNTLEPDSEIYCGELNDSYFLFVVYHDGRAVARLDSVLASVNLRMFASVLYLRHDLFRCFKADGAGVGCGFTLEGMREALARHKVQCDAILRASTLFYNELRSRLAKTAAPEKPDTAAPGETDPPK